MTDKAPDAFRNITEVSAQLNVPTHILRFWEARFSQVKPIKRSGSRRYYRPADIAVLTRIRDLLYDEGYTIKGAQQVLRAKTGEGAAASNTASGEGATDSNTASGEGATAPGADSGSTDASTGGSGVRSTNDSTDGSTNDSTDSSTNDSTDDSGAARRDVSLRALALLRDASARLERLEP